MEGQEVKPMITEDNDSTGLSSTSTLAEEASISPLQQMDNVQPEERSEPPSCSSDTSLSKSQLKKIAKKARWEDNKKIKRAKTKAKRKELQEKIKQGLISKEGLSRSQKKSNTMKESGNLVGVAIDMSFNHLMIEKDVAKTIKQIHRCYSINRRQQQPLQFYVTSVGDDTKSVMKRHSGWENWDVNFSSKPYTELDNYPKEKLVYLSSESENVLTELKPDCLYIIGGLVDHNSQKGLCHSLAVQKGVNHAKLPIEEYLDMKSRKVLTIDHVFEILVHVSQNVPWDKALTQVIPQRKMAQLKSTPS